MVMRRRRYEVVVLTIHWNGFVAQSYGQLATDLPAVEPIGDTAHEQAIGCPREREPGVVLILPS